MNPKIKCITELKSDVVKGNKKDFIYKILDTLSDGTCRIRFYTLGILNHEFVYDPITKNILAQRFFSTSRKSDIPVRESLFEYDGHVTTETVNSYGKTIAKWKYNFKQKHCTWIKESKNETQHSKHKIKTHNMKQMFNIVSRINALQWF